MRTEKSISEMRPGDLFSPCPSRISVGPKDVRTLNDERGRKVYIYSIKNISVTVEGKKGEEECVCHALGLYFPYGFSRSYLLKS